MSVSKQLDWILCFSVAQVNLSLEQLDLTQDIREFSTQRNDHRASIIAKF